MRSAMCAASQLPGRGPTVVDMAPVPACTCIKNLMMMMMMMMNCDIVLWESHQYKGGLSKS